MEKEGLYDSAQYLIKTLKDPGHHYYGVLWNKFYKTDIIRENSIKFMESVTLGEDFIFNLNYLKYCNKVQIKNHYLYYYNCENGNSLSRQYKKSYNVCENEYKNRQKIYKYYCNCFKETGLYEKYEKKIVKYWTVFYIRQLYIVSHEKEKPDRNQSEKIMKLISDSQEIQYAIKVNGKIKTRMEYMIFCIQCFIKNGVKKAIYFFRKVKGR